MAQLFDRNGITTREAAEWVHSNKNKISDLRKSGDTLPDLDLLVGVLRAWEKVPEEVIDGIRVFQVLDPPR